MWNDFRQRKPDTRHAGGLAEICREIRWVKELEAWFKGWFDEGGNTTWHFKKPHCTLVGAPNAGKTTAARTVLAGLRIFIPSSNKDFCLQGLSNTDYDCILWDDFELTSCNRRTLLCLMQGDFVSIDVKCNQAYVIQWQKPIIFTSNFNINDEAYNARTITINCNETCIKQAGPQ